MDGMKNTHAIQTSTSLCPPWAEHSNKIRALFADDPDVSVEYDAGAFPCTEAEDEERA